MIVATSGSNYNRILYSSSSPYSVLTTQSKSYKDPNYSSSRLVSALYIVDIDHAKSLVYDSSTLETYLVSINFLTEKISFQSTFP